METALLYYILTKDEHLVHAVHFADIYIVQPTNALCVKYFIVSKNSYLFWCLSAPSLWSSSVIPKSHDS